MIQTLVPSMNLRIRRTKNGDILEQMFWPKEGGAEIWVPVPIVTEEAPHDDQV